MVSGQDNIFVLDHTPADSVGNKSRTSPTKQWSSLVGEFGDRDGRVYLIGIFVVPRCRLETYGFQAFFNCQSVDLELCT